MSSSAHVDNKNKDILILDKGQTQGLYDNALTAKVQYLIKPSKSSRKFCLRLFYSGRNSFLSVNATKTYQFEAKDWYKKIFLVFRKIFHEIFQLITWKKQV